MQYLLLLFFILNISLYSQQSSISRSVNYISEYIASDNFSEKLQQEDHISLVDSIFRIALIYNGYDISETLLSLTFATVPYKKVPVTMPLINSTIYYLLISAEDSIFNLKNKNLPSRIFFDSPVSSYGDKDKIAHFFGNAYLGYNSTFLDISNTLGLFVEEFEKAFKVQSGIDERDLEANFYGRAFGKALKENEFVLPSQSLILYSLFYSIFQL